MLQRAGPQWTRRRDGSIRAPRGTRAVGEVLADRGAAADADEQPRSRRSPRIRRSSSSTAASAAPRATGNASTRSSRALRALDDDESLLIQSGKPVGVFRTHADAPRVLIANSNLVPKWATWEHFNELDRKGLDDVRPDDRRLVDLHRQPGHRAGHVRDVRRGGPPALRRRARRQVDPRRRASAAWAARSRSPRRWPARRCSRSNASRRRIDMRSRRAISTAQARDLDEALAIIAKDCVPDAPPDQRRACRQCGGNPAGAASRRGVRRRTWSPTRRPRTISSTATCRPAGPSSSWRAAQRRSRAARRRWSRPRRASIAAHVEAMLAFHAQGVPTFDYGNNIRQVALRRRRGRTRSTFRVSCPRTSGRCSAKARDRSAGSRCPATPRTSTRPIARSSELFPDDAHLQRWLDMARRAHRVPGTARAHLLAGAGRAASRGTCVQRDGGERRVEGADRRSAATISTRVSVASPNRETEVDGAMDPDAVSDWPLLNALLNTGGRRDVGVAAPWRRRGHGLLAARRRRDRLRRHRCGGEAHRARAVERSGVRRQRAHADAGYPKAIEVANANGLDLPMVAR